MRGAIPILHLCAFMSWKEAAFVAIIISICVYVYQVYYLLYLLVVRAVERFILHFVVRMYNFQSTWTAQRKGGSIVEFACVVFERRRSDIRIEPS
jgi:hypothetical protein